MRHLIGFIITVLFLFVGSSQAGFIDDWLGAKQGTASAPDYFEGQKRGYFTGGSFSARWNTGNDKLFTVVKPRIKSGCGGIDAFMGGFSFLNFDYLVQKLQNMIQAAPAIAFDIALKTLAEQVAGSSKDFEAIINALNNVQLNDCKAAQTLVGVLKESVSNDGKVGNELKKFATDSGIDNLYTSVSKAFSANKDTPTEDKSPKNANNEPDILAGCGSDIKDVIKSGSLLNNAAAKFGINTTHTDLIRGLVGDLFITKDSSSPLYKTTYIAPCTEYNKSADVESFISGNAYLKPVNGQCTPTTDGNANLINWATKNLLSVANKIKNKQVLTDEEKAFIMGIPLPLHSIVRTAVMTQQEGAILGTIAEHVANAHAYFLMSDIYYKAISVLGKIRELQQSQEYAVNGQLSSTCNVQALNISESANAMKEEALYYLGMLKTSYANSANELNAVYKVAEQHEKFYNMAKKELAAAGLKKNISRIMNR